MQRFKYWAVLFVGSLVVFASLKTFIDDIDSDQNGSGNGLSYIRNQQILASKNPILGSSGIISIVLSFLGLVVSVLRKNKYTYSIETVLIFLQTALWCFTMITLIFVTFYDDENGASLNIALLLPQIYFSSWGVTICSIMNFASWLKQHIYREDVPTATQWVLLVAMGGFLTFSAIAFAGQNVETVDPVTGFVSIRPVCVTAAYSCRSVQYTIVLSTVTFAVACAFLPCKNAPPKCQADIAMLLFIGWSVGVAIITFPPGPGVSIGNIYFGTWACFFLTLRILAKTTSSDATSNVQVVEIDPDRKEHQEVVVNRGDLFDVAYDQLENLAQFGDSGSGKDESASLYSSVEGSWSFIDQSSITDDRSTSQSQRDDKQGTGPTPRVYERNRLELWATHVIGSIVCLVSILPTLPEKEVSLDGERIPMIVPSISVAIGCIGFITCVTSWKYIELLMILSSIICWIVGTPFISELASDTVDYFLTSANVFFASFGTMFISLLLVTSWFHASLTTTDWVLLSFLSGSFAVSSYFLLTDEVNVEGDDGTIIKVSVCTAATDDGSQCNIMQFATYLGLSSMIVCMGMVYSSKWHLPVLFHVCMACVVFTSWVFAISFVTYDGHGSVASFAFFAVWLCFFIALDIASTNMVLFVKEREQRKEQRREQETIPIPDAQNGDGG